MAPGLGHRGLLKAGSRLGMFVATRDSEGLEAQHGSLLSEKEGLLSETSGHSHMHWCLEVAFYFHLTESS